MGAVVVCGEWRGKYEGKEGDGFEGRNRMEIESSSITPDQQEHITQSGLLVCVSVSGEFYTH